NWKMTRFKKNSENSNYIPGIYNYCDRWCERCPFTSRCLNFEMSEEKFGDLESVDLNNEEFWKKLGETLDETLNMLKEMAEEQGIDLDSLDMEENEMPQKQIDEETVVHILSYMSKAYITMVNDWFELNAYLFEHNEDEIYWNSTFDDIQSPPQEDMVTLIDSIEVVRWYQHQIYVKLKRALHSAQDEQFEILNNFPKDSDGSTKVALIGMDRSISAWGEILKYFPDQRKNIISMITQLERLRKRTENEFPDARAFVRPGFDEN
ncbi:MAG: hypothetical protein PVJ20_05730, partial [Desulfobacterales bacterium]